MLKVRMVVALFVLISIAGAATGPAQAGSSGLSSRQYAYPGYEINWQKKEGMPIDSDPSRMGLWMAKTDPLVENGHAGLAISGFSNPVEVLGFDVRDDGICNVSPYLKVTDTNGNILTFGCDRVTMTAITGPDGSTVGWHRATFTLTPIDVKDLRLKFELPLGSSGETYVDNIRIGDQVIKKSGKN